jgi:hypothetical protein
MAETTPTTTALLESIKGVPPLPPLVASAMGAASVQTFFESGEGMAVLGFYVKVFDALAQVYIVTSTSFVLVEAAKTGDQQIVTVPLGRIRELVDSNLNVGHRLTVEIDAGVQTIVSSHRPSELDPEAESSVQRVNFAVYVLEAAGDVENAALSAFATTFRGVLGSVR